MTIGVETRMTWDDTANGRVRQAVHLGLGHVAQAIQLEAKDNMGRGQERMGPPSAPGNPPNIQTGKLKASVNYAESGPFTWSIGTNLFYGRIHEFGNVSEGMIHPPRPWLRPAADLIVFSGRGSQIAASNAKRYLYSSVIQSAGTAAGVAP